MRRPYSILLHVLLSLALVANGIGTAMASAYAGCAHSAAGAAPIVESDVAEPLVSEPPCHGEMAAQSELPIHATSHQSAPDAAPSADERGDGDCENACDCACTAHAQAALMPPKLVLHASTRIAHAETFAYAYAAPALPHPVRPPIG